MAKTTNIQIEWLTKTLGIPNLDEYLMRVEKRAIEVVAETNPSIIESAARVIKQLRRSRLLYFAIAAAKCQDADVDDSVIRCAVAHQFLYMGTFLHDDITDNDSVRFGEPTTNALEGANSAFLMGNFFFTVAVQEALTISIEMANVVNSAFFTLHEGQSQEAADRYNLRRTINSCQTTILKKTGVLVSTAFRMGGLSVGLPETQVEALTKYGELYGIAAQQTDDLLNLSSTKEILGKPVNSDIREGVYNLPVILGLQGPEKDRLKYILDNLPRGEDAPPELLKLLISSGAIDETIQEIQRNNALAVEALKRFKKTAVIVGLSALPAAFFDFAIEYQTVRLRQL